MIRKQIIIGVNLLILFTNVYKLLNLKCVLYNIANISSKRMVSYRWTL